MRQRQIWALTAFSVSSVINPGYFAGCATSTGDPPTEDGAPAWQYGAAEMAELVLAANDSYELNIDGVAHRLDVDLEPVREPAEQALRGGSAFALTAYACGQRRLVATAQACVDFSTMKATGHVTLLRATNADSYETVASEVEVSGELESTSLALTYGRLSLKFDVAGQIELLSRDGKSFELSGNNLGLLATK